MAFADPPAEAPHVRFVPLPCAQEEHASACTGQARASGGGTVP